MESEDTKKTQGEKFMDHISGICFLVYLWNTPQIIWQAPGIEKIIH